MTFSRRRFCTSAIRTSMALGAGAMAVPSWLAGSAPAAVVAAEGRPTIPYGVASGDVTERTAVIWSRSDRAAQMFVEWATNERFEDARRVRGPGVLEATDFTGKLRLQGLPAGEKVFYRVIFDELTGARSASEPVVGSFRTPSTSPRDVLIAWSGDTAGQGFGINPDFGGMRLYEQIRRAEPDVFIHSGDTIYADGPIKEEVKLPDGSMWKNIVTPAKSKVAETLDEFRGNHAYNLLDENVRRFNAEVPLLVQWDDHETLNNWYPGELLDDKRYTVRDVSLLAARARRAFFDYQPIGDELRTPERIYRAVRVNPAVEVFLLDMRTYRGPNTAYREASLNDQTALLGREQTAWLRRKLRESKATWKIIASDMPLGIIVGDGPNGSDNAANGDGPPLGRELEIARLLQGLQADGVRNVVWLTADVHYAAAHYYDTAKARFTQFDGFWEFVAGPLNAGTFGPGTLDNTFGPEVRFSSVERGMPQNRPPSDGLQFFGTVRFDAKSSALAVSLINLAGERIYAVDLAPHG